MLRKRISNYLDRLMMELGETQEGLANRLGIAKSGLQGYLKGTNLPSIDILIRMAELGQVPIDDLIKTDNPIIRINVNNSPGAVTAGRDVIITQTHRRVTEYKPGPDDISGEQANELKDLVNKVVELEQKTKKKPKTYGAIWNALNRKMGVTYYREIKRDRFDEAKMFLMQYAGRLKRGLKRADKEEWRKERQKSIFAAAKGYLGWSKVEVDNYIYERYGKNSIRNLSIKELDQLYNVIFSKKPGR